MKAKRQTKRPEDINAALAAKKGPVSKFIAQHYRHFNAAALLDTAKGYETHLKAGGKMLGNVGGDVRQGALLRAASAHCFAHLGTRCKL